MLVEIGDRGKLLEMLGGSSKDMLKELCYILDLQRSGTKSELMEGIRSSEYSLEYVKRKNDFLVFGLDLMDYLSPSELSRIAREYDLQTYQLKWDRMVEIVGSEKVSQYVLLGYLTLQKLGQFYSDTFEVAPVEDRDRMSKAIAEYYELDWKVGGGDSGFIMMAMGEDGFLKRTYEVIKEECARVGIDAIRIDEVATSGVINDEVLGRIKESEYLFVDLTFERPNVYYELGYTHGLGKSLDRVVLTAKKGTRLHFDIRNMRTIFYEDHKQLRRELGKRLEAINKRDVG